MLNQPFYHTRPNKFIDRQIFLQLLQNLATVLPEIHNYQYIGFGSYLFDDFKLIHNQLGISNMVSLESDPFVSQRAEFNRPYKCIQIINQTSTDYISALNLESSVIAWLDYTVPSAIGSQFSDFCNILNIMKPFDIVKITLNANPATLGNEGDTEDHIREGRLNELRTRLDEWVPVTASSDDITFDNYPKLLIKCLQKAAMKTLTETLPYQTKFFVFLLSTIYQDGQQMLTLSGIVLNDHGVEVSIKQRMQNFSFPLFDWDQPCKINVPSFSPKEILHINTLLPSDNVQELIALDLPFLGSATEKTASITNYLNFYKYYPQFHHVNF